MKKQAVQTIKVPEDLLKDIVKEWALKKGYVDPRIDVGTESSYEGYGMNECEVHRVVVTIETKISI